MQTLFQDSFLTGTVYLFNPLAADNEKLFSSCRKQSNLLPTVHKQKKHPKVFFLFVDLGNQFWNQFAKECEYLRSILAN